MHEQSHNCHRFKWKGAEGAQVSGIYNFYLLVGCQASCYNCLVI